MDMTEINCEIGRKDPSSSKKKNIVIGRSNRLTLDDVKFIANNSFSVDLNQASRQAIEDSYHFLKSQVDSRTPVYGINTNFGDQVRHIDQHLKNENLELYYKSIDKRQTDIVSSLACSVGNSTLPEIVRTAILLRAHCLAQGYSAVSPSLIDGILKFLNAGIAPIVRQYGSIGASGDLIPLASIAAAMMGADVDVLYQGKIIKSPQALQAANLKKLTYHLRDGLALINGTSFMTAIASLSLLKLNRLFKQMLFAIAMSLESLLVISSAYHPIVHQLKHHEGEILINHFLLNFWKGSQLLSDLDEIRSLHMNVDSAELASNQIKPIQDCYSLRAVPQGFGSFQENLKKANEWIENEMNSVNDNPIIDVAAAKIHHNANFMGYYVSDACDILKTNISQASTWIHALLANMVHPRKSHGLPVNLAQDSSKNGFRSLQLLAAALAVQNRKLALSHPSFNLPTEGDNQDVNSLGTHAAFDLFESVTNLERLTSILFFAATQALEYRGIEKASEKSQTIYNIIRKCFPTVLECRPMSEEISLMMKILEEEQI